MSMNLWNNTSLLLLALSSSNLSPQDLVLEVGRTGQTRMDWLHESDLLKLKSLALLELEIIFADHSIAHNWRNSKKKKIKERKDSH